MQLALLLKQNGKFFQLVDINYAGVWDVNGSNVYYNGGNIGIGTDSPDNILHLYKDKIHHSKGLGTQRSHHPVCHNKQC